MGLKLHHVSSKCFLSSPLILYLLAKHCWFLKIYGFIIDGSNQPENNSHLAYLSRGNFGPILLTRVTYFVNFILSFLRAV